MIKMRVIARHNNDEPVYGVTIPQDVAIFFKETHFHVEKSGNSILLQSGTNVQLTKQDVDNFDLNSIRV